VRHVVHEEIFTLWPQAVK